MPWITGADISVDVINEAREYITEEAIEKSATNIVPKGNILLVTRTGVGKVAIAGVDICISQDFTGIIPDTSSVDVRYLFRLIQARKKYFELHQRGATIQGVTREVVTNLEVPLPALPEQQHIAAILDKADELRAKRRRAVARLDDLLQSVFLEMFGDPVTNSKKWEVRPFGEVGSLERGKSKHRPRNAPELLGGPYPLIQTGDIANSGGYITEYTQSYSELGLKQSRIWKAGVLCITIAANIAETGILTFDACFPDSVVGFIPNTLVRTEYVQYWLSFLQAIIEETAPAVAQKNINLRILRGLQIPVPPIELQDHFVKNVDKVQSLKDRHEDHLEALESLFNSLQQRAFRNELNVDVSK
jgi:type I restriction enzyme S subunit